MNKKLIDSFGRRIEYLRISVTDRCNLRCVYCMPQEAVFLPKEELLTAEEWLLFAAGAARAGIRKIRLTGGEPLLREDLPELVRGMAALPEIEQVVLTTNGVLLAEKARALKQAGITGVNLSLDSLDSDCYRKIAQKDGCAQAWEGLQACLEEGIPVKINCVPLKELQEKQLLPLAGLAKQYPIQVRFIEMMAIGRGKGFAPLPNDRIREVLEERFGRLEPVHGEKDAVGGPAAVYKGADFAGSIGFISSVSHSFCASCNRIRATADGKLKLCLHHPADADLRAYLRESQRTETEIAGWLEKLVLQKPENGSFTDEARPMWRIGG